MPTPDMMPTRRRVPWWAWTLVGCGCLAFMVPILAAIVIPVVFQARGKAQERTCLSNLRQCALAIRVYASDHDEGLPEAARWMDACESVGAERNVLRCPSVARRGPDAYGYAFDSNLSRKRDRDIEDPSNEAMVYDSTNLARNANDPGTSLPSRGRHMGRNNVGLVDGHAATLDSRGRWVSGSGYWGDPSGR